MGKILDMLTDSKQSAIWIKDIAYTQGLFGIADDIWLNADQLSAYRRKAQSLVNSGVVEIPLMQIIAEYVPSNEALLEALSRRPRLTWPLKALLSDESLRELLINISSTLRYALANKPLVLVMPSPRCWLTYAFALAFGQDESPEISEDDIDSAAVLLAEFLRTFGDVNIDGVLLDDSVSGGSVSSEILKLYRPVTNVGHHYRWDVGIKMPSAIEENIELAGFDFVIAEALIGNTPTVVMIPDSYWDEVGESVPRQKANLIFAEIPQNAVPESVLARLASLKTR